MACHSTRSFDCTSTCPSVAKSSGVEILRLQTGRTEVEVCMRHGGPCCCMCYTQCCRQPTRPRQATCCSAPLSALAILAKLPLGVHPFANERAAKVTPQQQHNIAPCLASCHSLQRLRAARLAPYLRGMKREPVVDPRPARPWRTGLYVIENSPR